jgi:hypothetical protein
MAMKKYFFRFGSFNIKDGSEIRFWEDKWMGNSTLREQYHVLYNIVHHKSDTTVTVLETSPPNVTFRRDLIGHRLAAWNTLLERLAMVQLAQGTDDFRWNLHEDGKFSVDSMYKALVHSEVPVDNNNKIWKLKVPLKTKIFAWYLRKGVIFTKDNLAKCKWHMSQKCGFCHHDETIKHLFFQCKFARSIW